MKKARIIILIVLVLLLASIVGYAAIGDCQPAPTVSTSQPQTDPEDQVTEPDLQALPSEEPTAESVSQTEPSETQATEPEGAAQPQATKPAAQKPGGNTPSAGKDHSDQSTNQTEAAPVPTEPQQTTPKETETTVPSEPEEMTPPIELPAETVPSTTEPTPTETPVREITYEFKRQVASYAAQYINQYRGSACTVLPGMSQVAQYRAGQLTRNYGHSTADKRAALAHFEYGRYIDATEFGDDPSNSYWEADSAEAICAGFYGTDPKAMGKKIADMIRSSSGHWSYISSSEYSYMGVGVEYREGTEYGWYCCVMVGSVNYG